MDSVVDALVVFFVVIDPLGLVPIFIALTVGFDARRRRLIALRGTGIGFAIIVFFAYFGGFVLEALEIGMPAFRISGGALLFWIAFEMLFQRRSDRKEQAASEARSHQEALDVSVFPLAIPLISGPGTITTTLLLMDEHGAAFTGQALVLTSAAAILGATAALLLAADRISRLLGPTIIQTVSRVLGILLAALAAQIIIAGVTAIYPP